MGGIITGMRKFLLLFVPVLFLCLVASCGNQKSAVPADPAMGKSTHKKGKGKKPAPRKALVETSKTVVMDMVGDINLVGTIRASKESVVSSEVAGRVVAVNKNEGDRVEKGEEVIKLDQASFAIALKGAKGEFLKALAKQKRESLGLARTRKLFEQNITSKEAMDDARLALDSAKAELMLATAKKEKAELDLARCLVKAPYAGFITARYIDEGEWIDKGKPMFEMVDIDHVEVILQVVDRIIGLINKNSLANVRIDGLPGKTFEGKVMAISPKADPEARTFLVKLVIDNKDGAIKAAMVARATIKTDKDALKVLVVPKDAVVMRHGKRAVFVDSGEGTVRELVVETGKETGDYVEVLSSGIKEGDMLVVTGNEILRNGSAIKVVGEKNYGKTG